MENTLMNLKQELKLLIIEALNLEGVVPEDIQDDAPLFGDGLGLDSIDALELGLAVKNKYNVVLSANNEETRSHFYSIDTLAAFIETQQK